MLAHPGDDSYVDALTPGYRGLVLLTLLKSAVNMTGADGWASLMINGAPVTEIKRPPPEFFVEQLKWLRSYADLRSDRVGEIHMQLDDMLSFFGAQAYLNLGRRSYSMQFLAVARSLAIHVETAFKFFCRAPRPIDFAMEVQPMVQTPDHSSYPSGHAMEAFAIATVLHRLSTGRGPDSCLDGSATTTKPLPFRLAHRIAVNRTVAGVHFPVDSRIGAFMGCVIGDLIWSIAASQPLARGIPDIGGPGQDFLLGGFDARRLEESKVTPSPISLVTTLWNRAAAEWPGKPALVIPEPAEAKPANPSDGG